MFVFLIPIIFLLILNYFFMSNSFSIIFLYFRIKKITSKTKSRSCCANIQMINGVKKLLKKLPKKLLKKLLKQDYFSIQNPPKMPPKLLWMKPVKHLLTRRLNQLQLSPNPCSFRNCSPISRSRWDLFSATCEYGVPMRSWRFRAILETPSWSWDLNCSLIHSSVLKEIYTEFE